jgi:hypothetical protein
MTDAHICNAVRPPIGRYDGALAEVSRLSSLLVLTGCRRSWIIARSASRNLDDFLILLQTMMPRTLG